MTENFLDLGIQAARRGENEKAVGYLSQAVKGNPASEEGWLWLGYALREPEKRRYCYERVLILIQPIKKPVRSWVSWMGRLNRKSVGKTENKRHFQQGGRECVKMGNLQQKINLVRSY